MSWLTPLGFLGFIALIALIIIYIIKPNYQSKIVSSTYIWKLSLKLRKKKIPISKLRNILLFICQVLIIAALTFILAQPIIAEEKEKEVTEKVAVIDASASMMASSEVDTRFERAVGQVRALAAEMQETEGTISIIIAADEASFVVQEMSTQDLTQIDKALDELLEANLTDVCTYGTGDLEGAIKLAEQITSARAGVEVLLYTDKTYIDDGNITVKNVNDPDEWNAAILDTRAIINENYYRFEIDVACYGGIDADIPVYCDIYGVNGEDGVTLNLTATARCMDDQTVTLVFGYDPEGADLTVTESVQVFSYNYAAVRIEELDSFDKDNNFYLYGGQKQTLKIQYFSALPNNYFASALMVLRDYLGSRWDVELTEVKPDENPESEGFDVYIYEHSVPKTLPNDGLVILANPDYVPSNAGLRLGKEYSCPLTALEPGDEHELMNGITPSNIEVTRFREITSYDGYVPLMYCNGTPLVMAKNEPDQKIVVMSFSLNYSTLALLPDFPLFLNNVFGYYMPSTVTEYVFEINETITMDARSESLNVIGPSTNVEITEFPGTVALTKPGVYTVSQTPISGNEVVENFYVSIPASESNIAAEEDSLTNPYFAQKKEAEDFDLLLYFALALVTLLFAEWWLQSREHF